MEAVRKSLKSFTSAVGALLVLLASPVEVAAANDLWAGSHHALPPATSSVQETRTEASAFGIELGQYVMFEGVGTVFYAGRAGGDVYFADLDEPGVFDWQGALAACGMKGHGWSLPTADQLKLLYTNARPIDLVAKDIRDTQGYWYWSSSIGNSEFAYRVRPYDGLQQSIKKKFSARVRCVRVY